MDDDDDDDVMMLTWSGQLVEAATGRPLSPAWLSVAAAAAAAYELITVRRRSDLSLVDERA